MTAIASRKLLLSLALSLLALSSPGFAQTPGGVCGSQAYCVETNDFAAIVTSFRTSTTSSNVKIIDATVHFQNKTSQQLILGYAINSGMATDDQGNRLVVAGANGYRGIGLVVAGTNFDPRFVIRPGGSGDAQFEFFAQGWPKIVGFTHSLELTVNEINSFEGNQHTIGGEFPLHFQGLKNGSASASGLSALTNIAGNAPCGLAGAQGVAGQAGGAVSTAANTISNLGSLFHKKKTEQNAAQVANSAAGCDPRVNTVASAAGGLAGMAAASNGQQTNASATMAQAQQMANSSATPAGQQTADVQAAMNSAAAAQTSSQAGAAVASNPANLAAGAFSKMKLAQLKRQQKTAATQTQAASPQQVASLNPAAAASPTNSQPNGNEASMSMVGAQLQGAQLEEQANPNQMTGSSNKAVSAGKYDILGIRIGMSGKEAAAVLRSRGMQLKPETIKYDFLAEPLTYGVTALNQQMLRTSGAQPGGEKVYIMLNMPPNQQTVAKVSRFMMFSKDTAPSLQGLVADLIKKYGTPSYDSRQTDLYQSGYREFYWVDDAQGHRLNVTAPSGSYNEQVNNCRSIPTFAPSGSGYPNDPGIEVDSVREKIRLEKGYYEEHRVLAYCANLTMVYAKLIYGYPIGVAAHDVVGGMVVVIGSAPVDRVATEATHNFLMESAKQRDARQKQAAQKNKPAL